MMRSRHLRTTDTLLSLVVVAALCLPSVASAAWLGFKNDTNVPVIIQTATVVNNQLRWGKPHSLFPGEVAWDAVPSPGARLIGVFDPKQNNRLAYKEQIVVGNADIFLSLQIVTPPPVRGVPQQPQPRFIPTKPPSQPPGTPITGPNTPRIQPPKQPANPNPPTQKPPANPPGKSGGN